MPDINIRAVAAKTGLNAATLRTWERRYEAVVPVRQPNGIRTYNDAAVNRIRLLKRATELGLSISRIAKLDDSTLEKLIQEEGPRDAPQPQAGCIAQLLNSIERMDLADFERLLYTAALAFTPMQLVTGVVSPVMVEVGQRWEAGVLNIADEHAISAVVCTALSNLNRSFPAPRAGAPVLLATLPNERHELPLQMLRHVLASQGVPVHYLGIDLPASEIARTAGQLKSSLIVLSATHTVDLDAPRLQLNALLHALGPGAEVWVGGAQAAALTDGMTDPRLHAGQSLKEIEQRAWLLGN